MDIIRFINPTHPLKMEQAFVVNGLRRKMWVERYAKAGEFSFTCDASVQMKQLLPVGSFVSHIDTHELMRVENHEIKVVDGKPSELTITGRGFETIFEGRVVGSNKAYPAVGEATDYVLDTAAPWDQILALIMHHIFPLEMVDVNDGLPWIASYHQLAGIPELGVDRSIRRADLYSSVLELLNLDNLGIRSIRPGPWSPAGHLSPYANNTIYVEVHKGKDLTKKLAFSEDSGEISNAEYLWSNKGLKNAALVTGRWVQTKVIPADVELDRRWMPVEASDIDDYLEEAPVGAELDEIVARMQQRGAQVLSTQRDVALTKVEASKNSTRFHYRVDFNVGDLVTVLGSYNETSVMRVSEYVEIEDETGSSRYPTLELV